VHQAKEEKESMILKEECLEVKVLFLVQEKLIKLFSIEEKEELLVKGMYLAVVFS